MNPSTKSAAESSLVQTLRKAEVVLSPEVPNSPRLTKFAGDVQTSFQVLARTMRNYMAELVTQGPIYFQRAEHLVDLTCRLADRLGLSYDDVLDAYAEFCFTFLREQDEFLRTGEYRNASEGFEAVKHEVYENDEYMTHYMLGHLLSCAVFPHHYEQYKFFTERFVPGVADRATAFEFGCGHGMWISTFLRATAERRGQAVDISPLCVRMAGKMMELQNLGSDRITVSLADAVQYDLGSETYDAMIASGLLEHIEDPAAFLRRIRPHLRAQTGRLFTMVPTNTAHPDHLVLFTRVEEIQAMYHDAGYRIVEERILDQGTLGSGQSNHVSSLLHLGILARAE